MIRSIVVAAGYQAKDNQGECNNGSFFHKNMFSETSANDRLTCCRPNAGMKI
jgi:hypothetical protein